MSKKIYSVLAALFLITPSCSQNKTAEGYIILESEISAGEIKQIFMPKKTLIIDAAFNVLEFHEKFSRKDNQFTGADTLNVFFINTKKNTYSAYKKLNSSEKPYLRDSVDSKKDGITFYSKKVDLFSNVENITIKDSLIDQNEYKLALGSKESENGKLLYKAYIRKEPRLFPVQISSILSEITGGGFVERIEIKDLSNNKTLIFKCSFQSGAIPVNIVKVMRAWSKN